MLTLMVPGLLLPVEILETTAYDLDAPTLSRILGSGTRQDLQADWLAESFGLGHLPAAVLRKVSSGETAPGDWICLDPVRWQISSEGVTLDDPARLELDTEESAELLAAVQPLFADLGELSASAPSRWELHLQQPVALETEPLPVAIQQAIDPHQPGGADGAAWRRLLAEAQTILHAHPVNRRREEAGRPTVNSLWPWGFGSLPERVQTGFTAVWSDDPVLAGLCRLAGIPCAATPARFEQADRNLLATVETLATPARSFDALAWRDALLALERDWLVPAVKTCQSLRVVGTRLGPVPATVSYTLKRSDRLRFWRKPLPLTALT